MTKQFSLDTSFKITKKLGKVNISLGSQPFTVLLDIPPAALEDAQENAADLGCFYHLLTHSAQFPLPSSVTPFIWGKVTLF